MFNQYSQGCEPCKVYLRLFCVYFARKEGEFKRHQFLRNTLYLSEICSQNLTRKNLLFSYNYLLACFIGIRTFFVCKLNLNLEINAIFLIKNQNINRFYKMIYHINIFLLSYFIRPVKSKTWNFIPESNLRNIISRSKFKN